MVIFLLYIALHCKVHQSLCIHLGPFNRQYQYP